MSRRRVLYLVSISLFIGLASMLLRHLVSSPNSKLKLFSNMSTQNAAKERGVIVVGSGLAGLTAASTLISHGIRVQMLERAAKPGGNSMKASSGINGAPTKYQPGPPFSDTFFHADTVKSAGAVYQTSFKKERESLIGTLTNRSAAAIEWLTEEKGVNLSVVAQLGGHSFPRTHRGAGKLPPGASLVTTLLKSLKESPLFELDTECTVTKVLKPSTAVTGVEYLCGEKKEPKRAEGPVIFATGGFAGDAHGMLAKYRPDLAGFPSTNDPRPGSQDLLTAIGAQLLDMEQVQVHPTSFIDPANPSSPVKFLAAELLRGEGGVLLFEGKRFVNEMETRKVVTEAITNLPISKLENQDEKVKQWEILLILDEGVYKNASSHIDFYLWKKLMRKATIKDLGPTALASLKDYASGAAGHSTDLFKRDSFGHWELHDVTEDSVVYVGTVTPAVHFTMGGALISAKGEVIGEDGKGIEGIWAAGEVSGGVHGENRLGGSSLLECVVFGRVVGDEAARYLQAAKE
ncbi:related to fumarate reductase, flavoprotein subunit [Phialocephala subalpina]|uniref:Fumarate reductase n=1 Tax=Phialocephala subalpina TaxID=576137 RepID=A0A1L7XJ57_9HELO|nr:related to fumarate reductase, flavoprotein subunit [Phialocephala subalpina]